jgi:hypothetical protein
MRTRIWLVCALALTACATAKKSDGGNDKAPVREAHEIVSGGGLLKGGTIRAAVTVGGPLTPHGAHRQGVVQQ